MSTDTTPWNQTTVRPDNVHHWLAMIHDLADFMRGQGDRPFAALLDLMAVEVETCADDGWHDAEGRKVEWYEYRWSSAPRSSGNVEIQMSLKPTREATPPANMRHRTRPRPLSPRR